jgi:malonyl CoA-acyl carrier protein transacylase
VAGLIEAFHGQIDVAAYNAPSSVVLSGDPGALARAVGLLRTRALECTELPGDYAFHSAQLSPLQEDLAAQLAFLRPRSPALPIVSTLTGGREADFDARYWSRQMREPVRFSDAIEELIEGGVNAFVELGPHPVLLSAIEAIASASGTAVTLTGTLRRDEDPEPALLEAVGELHCVGHEVNWGQVLGGVEGRVATLPSYPWQRQRHWLNDRGRSSPSRARAGEGEPAAASSASRSRTEAEALGRELRELLRSSAECGGGASLADLGVDSLGLIRFRRIVGMLPDGRELARRVRGSTPGSEILDFITRATAHAMESVAPEFDVSTIGELIAGVSWLDVPPRSVNKRSLANVLLRRCALATVAGAPSVVAELRLDQDHAFFYERLLDHVPGLYLIEGARQLANWWEFARSGSLPSGGTLDHVAADFFEFVEHNEPAYLVAIPAGADRADISVIQAGRLKALLAFAGRRIAEADYARIREAQRSGAS